VIKKQQQTWERTAPAGAITSSFLAESIALLTALQIVANTPENLEGAREVRFSTDSLLPPPAHGPPVKRHNERLAAQLLCSRCPLFQDYLFMIRQADNDLCPNCRTDPDTVAHVPEVCPAIFRTRSNYFGGEPWEILSTDPRHVIRFIRAVRPKPAHMAARS
jgi:hypothetical protein